MAKNVTIGGNGDLFVGEDKGIRLEVLDPEGYPVDLTGWTINFVVRLTDAADDPALLTKTATIAGTFDADRDINTQYAGIILSDDETNTFSAQTYRHSWKRMNGGYETLLAYGNFILELATAR
jgi:hypothetical protein